MGPTDDAISDGKRHSGAALAELRAAAGLAQGELALAIAYDRTTVAHAERGRQVPAVEFWQACDDRLGARGQLVAAAPVQRPSWYPTTSAALPQSGRRRSPRSWLIGHLPTPTSSSPSGTAPRPRLRKRRRRRRRPHRLGLPVAVIWTEDATRD